MTKIARSSSLDLLRILTTLLIVVYHAHKRSMVLLQRPFFSSWFDIGFLGVDIFFVLSGLLLAKSYMQNLFGFNDSLLFLKKRLQKIYPFFLTFTLIFFPLFFMQPVTEAGCNNKISIAILSIFLIPQLCPPVLSIAWTLPIQVYCYFWFVLHKNKHIFVRVGAAVIAIVTVINYLRLLVGDVQTQIVPFGAAFFVTPYLLEFMAGLALAQLPRLTFGWLWAIILFWLSYATGLIHGDTHRVVSFGLGAFFVVNCFDHWNWNVPTKFQSTLKYLSEGSYFVFLTHFQFQSLALFAFNSVFQLTKYNYLFVLFFSVVISVSLGLLAYEMYNRVAQFFLPRTTSLAATTLPD